MSKLGNFLGVKHETLSTKIDSVKHNRELLEHMLWLKSLNNREYILTRKYEELSNLYKKFGKTRINNYPRLMMNFEDVQTFMRNEKNDIQVVECDTSDLTTNWLIGRSFVSSAPTSVPPGRNLQFFIYINGKIAGFLSLSSDVISIKCRDEYIGWDRDVKFKTLKRLNYTSIGSTIVPVQPLGSATTGGKLLCLILHHKMFDDLWKKRYNQTLAGMTTTSLFGINSQYLGMPKYWKTLGETNGEMSLAPLNSMYNPMKQWVRENISSTDWDKIVKGNGNGPATGPKTTIMDKYYRLSGFNDLWKKETGFALTKLKTEFKRGTFFAKRYNNTLEFLRGEIDEKDLIPRDTFDFDIDDLDGMVAYWKRKWAIKRWKKQESICNRTQLFKKLKNINSLEDFMKEYM